MKSSSPAGTNWPDALRGVMKPPGLPRRSNTIEVAPCSRNAIALPEEAGGAIGERRQANVADAVLEHPGVDFLEVDHRARDRNLELVAVALDCERDLGPGLAPHLEDQRADRLADRRGAVDLEHTIAGPQPRPLGG